VIKATILGGNIAGLVTGMLLAEKGAEVEIYERRITWDKPCGGMMDTRYVNWLEKHNVFFEDKYTTPEYVFVINKRKYPIKINPPIQHLLNRQEIQEKLMKIVKDLGGEIKNTIITMENLPDLTNEADFVVVALGHSKLSWTLLNRTYATDEKLVCRLAEIPVDLQLPIIFATWTNTIGYGWVFPKPGRVNIGYGHPIDFGIPLRVGFDKFINELNECLDLDLTVEKSLIRGGKLPADVNTLEKPFFSNQDGKLFVGVGDAIGLANPINGGGMCNAIKSARALVTSLNGKTIDSHKYSTLLIDELGREWKDAKKNRGRIKRISQNRLLRPLTGSALALFGRFLVPRLYRKAIAH
jgi:flavin-dependent dehydrogenase